MTLEAPVSPSASRSARLSEILAPARPELVDHAGYHDVLVDDEQLGPIAELYPNWGIETGFMNGAPFKRITRTIASTGEGEPELDLPHKVYKRLGCDGEYHDRRLAEIFDQPGFEGMNGLREWTIHFDVSAGPITWGDLLRVELAERHLESNYVLDANGHVTDALPVHKSV